jgi:hypothetical protein
VSTYTLTKLFRAKSVSTLHEGSLYAPSGQVIIKELLIANTTGASVTTAIGVIDAGSNILDGLESGFDGTVPDASGLGHALGSWVPASTGLALTRSASFGYLGTSNCMQLKVTGTTAPTARTGFFAIQPLTAYLASAAQRAGGTGRSMRLMINWYAAENAVGYPQGPGALISTSTLATQTDGSSGFFPLSGSATSPAGAFYAQLQYQSAVNVITNEIHYLDGVLLTNGAGVPLILARDINDRFFTQALPTGLTQLGCSVVLNAGDSLFAIASAAGVNIVGSGVVLS